MRRRRARPARAWIRHHGQSFVADRGERAEFLARGVQVGERIGFLFFAVPAAAGEGRLDDAIHPGDEVGGVLRRGRRRRLEVDRARRRVRIEVEHPGIRLVVEGAQHDPAAGVERRRRRSSRSACARPSSLNDLITRPFCTSSRWSTANGAAHRDAHRPRASAGQRIARSLAVDLEAEQRTVADERAAGLQRIARAPAACARRPSRGTRARGRWDRAARRSSPSRRYPRPPAGGSRGSAGDTRCPR